MREAYTNRLLTRAALSAGCCLLSLAVPSRNARLLAQGISTPPRSAFAGSSTETSNLFMSTDAMLVTVLVGSFLLIEPLEGFDQSAIRHLSEEGSQGNSPVRRSTRALGTLPATLAVTGGTFLLGRITGHSALQRAGLHSLEAVLVAAGATQALKFAVGRGRPTVNRNESDDLRPFRFSSDYHSFPSGHTSQIFAAAATFSSELRDQAPWVPLVVYPLATWTASTRVLDGKHWVTDVVAGAALGILSSRLVERLHHGKDPQRRDGLTWTVVPGDDGGIGFAVSAPLR